MRNAILILPLLALAGCKGGGDAVPKPRAFHRIATPEARYDTLAVNGVSFLANAAAAVARNGNSVTITYPNGLGTMYCSFTPVSPQTRAQVIDNRTERMALNAGTSTSEVTTLTSKGGYQCSLMVTPAGTPTPVQFIAVADHIVVTGTFYMELPTTFQPDSIAPVVAAISRDALQALGEL